MKMRAFWMLAVALLLAGGSVYLARNWLENQVQPVIVQEQAAPETQNGQRQEQQHQPRAGVFPALTQGVFTAGEFTAPQILPQRRCRRRGAKLRIDSTPGIRHRPQAGTIEPGDHHIAKRAKDRTERSTVRQAQEVHRTRPH